MKNIKISELKYFLAYSKGKYFYLSNFVAIKISFSLIHQLIHSKTNGVLKTYKT